jgi:DNA polymerase-3 subunit gamma/tau
MSYKVLALKWRPRNFAAVVGQQATLLALQHALDQNQLHHAYLFTGTRGVGKTTIARILAKCLNCKNGITSQPCGSCELCISIDNGSCVDVIEIDAASRTKVEDTRELLENVPYAPVQGRFKVYIIDEVHMLSNHSFNALLKTLEEPPAHVKFILATTDPQKLPITVVSRCLQFHLRNFTIEQIQQQLANILTQEKISFETAALQTIAQCASGSMRDALSLLEQVIAFGENSVTLDAAQQILGTAVTEQTWQLLEYIIKHDARSAIALVRDMAANNVDFNHVLKILQSNVHQLSLLKIVPQGLERSGVDVVKLQELATQVAALDLQIYYQATLMGARDLPYAPDLVTGFEMIVLRMLAFEPVLDSKVPIAVVPPLNASAAQQVTTSVNQGINSVASGMDPMTNVSQNMVSQPIMKQQTSTIANITVKDWAEIIPQLNLTGLSKLIAENCNLESVQEGSVVLTLHEAQKPLLNAKHTERIQEALQKYYQRPLKLTINVGVVKSETPAAQGQRLQQEAHSAAEAAIRADATLQQFTETFAATITDIQVKSN